MLEWLAILVQMFTLWQECCLGYCLSSSYPFVTAYEFDNFTNKQSDHNFWLCNLLSTLFLTCFDRESACRRISQSKGIASHTNITGHSIFDHSSDKSQFGLLRENNLSTAENNKALATSLEYIFTLLLLPLLFKLQSNPQIIRTKHQYFVTLMVQNSHYLLHSITLL